LGRVENVEGELILDDKGLSMLRDGIESALDKYKSIPAK
jgi:hypothetical protein